MSVLFVVNSEEQLSSGVAWCRSLMPIAGGKLHVAVAGSDRKALTEHVKGRVADEQDLEKVSVKSVEADVAAVLAHAKSLRCKYLLMVYHDGETSFQRELFEASVIKTVWVSGDPHQDGPPNRVMSVFAERLATTVAAEVVLHVIPTSALCKREFAEDESLIERLESEIDAKEVGTGDLIVCGAGEFNSKDVGYQAGLVLLEKTTAVTIAVVHTGHSFGESLAMKIHQWVARIAPPMDREARIKLAKDLELGSRPNLEFLGLMSAASMLASSGLLQNSAAVIIGAMLIAPLMTPIVGAGLSLTHGNRPLFQSSLKTIALGFFGALVASILFGWLSLLFREPEITDEMWARCQPSPLDFSVGLVGGIAASYARTREHLSSALAGAAIAAALVPPISTAGLQIAFWNWESTEDGATAIIAPLVLVGINVVTIMIGSSLVLWVRGMRSDPTRTIRDRWPLRTIAPLCIVALLTLLWIIRQ